MKRIVPIVICLFALGCSTVEVKKESPESPKLKKYKTIHLGWIEFPAGKWKEFGYGSPAEWQKAVYNLNANVLLKYFKSSMPGNRKILGPSRGAPRTGDLFIKFVYLSYEARFVAGRTTPDRLNLRVEMIENRTGRKIYTAVLGLDSYRPGPGDWSVYGLEGRMAMEVRNLADFIGGKF